MASAGILVQVLSPKSLQGSYATFPLTLICVVCTGLTAVYFVILLNRTCFGKLDNDTAYYPQVKFSEQVPALVLAATIFFLGIQPTWLVRWSETTTNAMVAAVQVNSERQLTMSFAEPEAMKPRPVKTPIQKELILTPFPYPP